MSERGRPEAPIRPEAYTEEYFRTSVEGHEEFAASGGRSVSPRLPRALELADPKPGQRVLDIACGRGEMVLQSALRGADALGIDGATAGGRIALARMDATRLALAPHGAARARRGALPVAAEPAAAAEPALLQSHRGGGGTCVIVRPPRSRRHGVEAG